MMNKGIYNCATVILVVIAVSHGHVIMIGVLGNQLAIPTITAFVTFITNFHQGKSVEKLAGSRKWPQDAATTWESSNDSNWNCWNCAY